MSDLVLVDRPAPQVAVVTLNRPGARNALSQALVAALGEALREVRDEVRSGGLRAVVLTGADPAFCAGVDLKEAASGNVGAPESATDVLALIVGLGVPVIGAINGPAVTGGLELALACDFRIASERARFADTHARVGVIPGWGLTVRLPEAVGQAWARRMSMTGNYVDAATAERIGLVTSVVPHEELLTAAVGLATDVTGTDPGTAAAIRSLYDSSLLSTGAETLRAEEAAHGDNWVDSTKVAGRVADVFDRGRSQTRA